MSSLMAQWGPLRFPALPAAPTPKGPVGGNAGGSTGSAKTPVDHNAIRTIVGKMPAPGPSPLQQAQDLVASELDPLRQQLLQGYAQSATSGGKAIQALTAQYAHDMGAVPGQLAGIYAPAEQQTAAVNSALADRLSGAGNQASDDLASRLASIQQPGAVNPVVNQIAQAGEGAGNALYGQGSASLEQLIGNAANAQTYAAKLPGIANLAGLQQLAGFRGQIGAAQAAGLADLAGKAPGLVQSAYGTLSSAQNAADNRTAANQRAGATIAAENARTGATINAENARTAATTAAANKRSDAAIKAAADRALAADTAKRRDEAIKYILQYGTDPVTHQLTPLAKAWVAKLGGPPQGTVTGNPKDVAAAAALKERVAHDKVAEDQAWARISVSQQNANKTAASAVKVIGSAATGTYAYDPATGKKTLLLAPTKKAAKPGKGLTPTQKKNWTGELTNLATGMLAGGTDPKTNQVHPSLSYVDALKYLADKGWLSSPQSRALTLSILKRVYGSHEVNIAAGSEYGPAKPTGVPVGS